jgi:hypothetical protein
MATHLGDGNDLAIRTPTGIFEELGYLRALSGSCLPHNDGDGACLDEV